MRASGPPADRSHPTGPPLWSQQEGEISAQAPPPQPHSLLRLCGMYGHATWHASAQAVMSHPVCQQRLVPSHTATARGSEGGCWEGNWGRGPNLRPFTSTSQTGGGVPSVCSPLRSRSDWRSRWRPPAGRNPEHSRKLSVRTGSPAHSGRGEPRLTALSKSMLVIPALLPVRAPLGSQRPAWGGGGGLAQGRLQAPVRQPQTQLPVWSAHQR